MTQLFCFIAGVGAEWRESVVCVYPKYAGERKRESERVRVWIWEEREGVNWINYAEKVGGHAFVWGDGRRQEGERW